MFSLEAASSVLFHFSRHQDWKIAFKSGVKPPGPLFMGRIGGFNYRPALAGTEIEYEGGSSAVASYGSYIGS